MNDFVELQRIFNLVLRRLWLLVVLTAAAGWAGYEISRRQMPAYEATATVLVGQITQSSNLSREDVQMSALFAQTYADLAIRQPVLQGVVEMLGLKESWQDLRKRVQVAPIGDTQLIEIRAEAESPQMAVKIADEVAKHLILVGPANLNDSEDDFAQTFVHQQMEDTQTRILSGQKRIKEIEAELEVARSTTRMLELQTEKTNLERLIADNVTNYVELSNLASQDRKPNSLSVIETAHSSNIPIRPRVNLNILLGCGFGMLLALGLIFLWEYLDDSIKSADDLSQFGNLNVLGAVGRIKVRNDSRKIVTHLDPSSPTSESFRMIRNKLRFGSADELPKSIVVTSPQPEEGKSITAANLGIIMAKANIKTILVDADLSHPVLHDVFNVKFKSGLADLINSPLTGIQDCLKKTSIDNLQIITGGETSQDQTERLSAERISEILKTLQDQAEIIIIDSPPVLLTADAAILSNRADGVIVVVRAGKSKRKAVRQALIDLQEANANILGCIYNQVSKDNNSAIYTRHKQEKTLIQHLKALLNIG
jgi:non-specific protein-tyrosine kinase